MRLFQVRTFSAIRSGIEAIKFYYYTNVSGHIIGKIGCRGASVVRCLILVFLRWAGSMLASLFLSCMESDSKCKAASNYFITHETFRAKLCVALIATAYHTQSPIAVERWVEVYPGHLHLVPAASRGFRMTRCANLNIPSPVGDFVPHAFCRKQSAIRIPHADSAHSGIPCGTNLSRLSNDACG